MKELITSKQFTTFNEMHKALADKAPDKVALVCGSVTYTFAELDRAIDNDPEMKIDVETAERNYIRAAEKAYAEYLADPETISHEELMKEFGLE